MPDFDNWDRLDAQHAARESGGGDRRRRLVVLQNILAPYRVPILSVLARRFETTLILSGAEDNRSSWSEVEKALDGVDVLHGGGPTIRTRRGKPGYDQRYLHLPVGHFFELARIRPDAIISIEMGLRTIIALTFGTLTKTPVWVWWGGTLHTERRIGVARRLIRALVVRWARRWISYGATSTEYLTSIGVPRRRILQIQNCVDEALFSASSDPVPRVSDHPVFLHVGRLIGLKGIDRLLDAAALLQAEGRHFALMLVGDGPEREALEERAKRLGLEDVHFIAAHPPERMPEIYRSADYLVFPTLGDVWGLVVNEALWSGIPVLCSIHAGCAAELVPEGQRFDPEDPEQIAARMRDALEGRVPPPDTSAMRTAREVAEMIADDVDRALGVWTQ